jgi:hypothetical protein
VGATLKDVAWYSHTLSDALRSHADRSPPYPGNSTHSGLPRSRRSMKRRSVRPSTGFRCMRGRRPP